MNLTPPKLVRVAALAATVRKVEQDLELENGPVSAVSLMTVINAAKNILALGHERLAVGIPH
jgi:hypothetical protein